MGIDRERLFGENTAEAIWQRYANVLEQILLDQEEAITEYELLDLLERRGFPEFRKSVAEGTLGLFQSHFLLFHLLYRLRDQLHSHHKKELSIHCLKIEIVADLSADGPSLVVADPLRDYYLDLTHLSSTRESDVQHMLDQFWVRYHAREHLDEALATLELDKTAPMEKIKTKYRILAREAHPDHGGSPEDFIRINHAMEIISRANGI